jgi:hypothetical protein
MVVLDANFEEMSRKAWHQEEHERQYAGVEDLRLYRDEQGVGFVGTIFNAKDCLGVGRGRYDDSLDRLVCKEVTIVNQGSVEKNWVVVPFRGETCMIYKWQPLTVCRVSDENVLEPLHRKQMPGVFNQCRGSTNACVAGDDIWFIVHIVSYEAPRRYYHMFVVMDKDLENLRYSPLRSFAGESIEYCIGMVVEDERVVVSYSTWDRTTTIGVMDRSEVEKLLRTA